jgi:hypothetical protein
LLASLSLISPAHLLPDLDFAFRSPSLSS